VHRYEILDSPPDDAFDEITKLTARLLQVPIALVTIVDTDRIWFKSHHGLQVKQVPRDPGLCASAILSDQPWIITDAATDPRARDNPLVSGEFGLRFYAGVPLRSPDGHAIGTLCIVDFVPRQIDDDAIATLRSLASLVMNELELRVAERERLRAASQRRREAEQLAQSLQESLLPGSLPATPGLDVAARYHVANREQVGGDFYDVIDTGDAVALAVGDVCGKGTGAAAMTGRARWALRALVLESWTPARALERLNRVLVKADSVAERYCTVALAKAERTPTDHVRVTLSLGGHPRPLVVRSDGSIEHAGRTAPIIGYFGDASFHDAEVTLEWGDLMIMFTDGMLEAVQGHGSTEDGALRALLAPLAGYGAHGVADRLDAALRTSALCEGSLRDDAAYLVLRAVP
jgi:sigma-B regulation protein RsbU (phosphoserine phosphatase)